jgi:hypothetical protein
MIERYVTDPAVAVVPRFVPLGAVWITHHPVEDPGPGLAHLTYAGALALAAANGARLPTRAEVFALHEAAAAAGTEVAILVLPDAALLAEGCVPGDPRMVTRVWCDIHDARVLAAMAADQDSDAPVANVGKHWIGPAPATRAALCGWWVADVHAYGSSRTGPGFVQSGDDFPHDDQHSDYATTTMLVRDQPP